MCGDKQIQCFIKFAVYRSADPKALELYFLSSSGKVIYLQAESFGIITGNADKGFNEAKREVQREYQDLCEDDDIFMLSRDELIVHMRHWGCIISTR